MAFLWLPVFLDTWFTYGFLKTFLLEFLLFLKTKQNNNMESLRAKLPYAHQKYRSFNFNSFKVNIQNGNNNF